MHIRSLILATVAAMSFAGAAQALTLQEAMSEVAGYHCSGSSCTSSETVSTTVDNPDIVTVTDNPDIVTSSEELVSPATSSSAPNTSLQSFGHCPPMRTMNGGWTKRTNVNADCTALSLNPGSGGSPAVYRTVTTTTDGGTTEVITDGGTSIVDSCSTTTKTLTYNGPNTDRAGAWSVDSSSSSSDGSC